MILCDQSITWLGSSLTDWVGALAALIAVPGAIAGFIILFRKDKDKQHQIDRLTDIANKFDAQNIIMQEGNKLLSDQVEVLRSMLVSQMKVSEGQQKLADIEEEKHLLSIRPRLFSNGGLLRDKTVQFYIENYGETAFIKSVSDLIEPKQVLMRTAFPQSLEIAKGKSFIIYTETAKGQHWNSQQIDHHFRIEYADQAGNVYEQEIYGVVGKKYHTSDPVLIKRVGK